MKNFWTYRQYYLLVIHRRILLIVRSIRVERRLRSIGINCRKFLGCSQDIVSCVIHWCNYIICKCFSRVMLQTWTDFITIFPVPCASHSVHLNVIVLVNKILFKIPLPKYLACKHAPHLKTSNEEEQKKIISLHLL